jgi:phenylalanyl-tRNA synthetase beta chain
MKFDVDWLIDLLDGTPEVGPLADGLTACGCLVELREKVGDSEVWEVEITTNRPDAMNHRGLAREAAVAMDLGLRPVDVELDEDDEPAADLAAVEIIEPDSCPRYVARIVRGVRVQDSPEWLQRRLENCGVRPINAVVDATNYVLLELGQPLHAFDLPRLAGSKIVVRRAASGEVLTTLDGQRRTLTDRDLVIADGERAVALAGIMGGADTEIGEDTTDILIESAHFDALTVRRTARRLGMHTEASHRFERGSDPEMAAVACDVAAALIARLTGGRVSAGRIDAYPLPRPAARIEFSISALSAFAGLEISVDDVVRILTGLDFRLEVEGDVVTVSVPSHRIDVERVADLYEEVLRHVGYGAVPSKLPVLSTTPGSRNANWELVDRGREAAIRAGLVEIMTWSFIDTDDDALTATLPLCPGSPLELCNPLAQTQRIMRRSLLPGMLAAARGNLNQGERSLAIFEQGRVFYSDGGSPSEDERLGIVVSGSPNGDDPVGFFDLKGTIEAVLEMIGFPTVIWRRGGEPWFDESEGAVLSDAEGKILGCAGRLAAELIERWEIKQPVYAAELDLGAALADPPLAQFEELPRYPAVMADMTIEHTVELTFAELVDAVRGLAADRVETVDLRDRYAGENLSPDVVRTTLRLVYRHPDRSLTQEEVNDDQNRLREGLAERLGVKFA